MSKTQGLDWPWERAESSYGNRGMAVFGHTEWGRGGSRYELSSSLPESRKEVLSLGEGEKEAVTCERSMVFPGHFGVRMVWEHSGLAWLQQGPEETSRQRTRRGIPA